MSEQPFTEAEVNQAAREDLYLILLGSIAYAKATGHNPSDWIAFMGRAGAATDTVTSGEMRTPRQAVGEAAKNYAACNLRFVSLESDERRAEVVMTDAEDLPHLLRLLNLSLADADMLHDIYQPIAEAIGMRFSWRRVGNQVHFAFEKRT